MGTISELLKIIDKFKKSKTKHGTDKSEKNFKEVLREEMKNLNKAYENK